MELSVHNFLVAGQLTSLVVLMGLCVYGVWFNIVEVPSLFKEVWRLHKHHDRYYYDIVYANKFDQAYNSFLGTCFWAAGYAATGGLAYKYMLYVLR